jgi:ATP-binding protein involved in chromosome partitioning
MDDLAERVRAALRTVEDPDLHRDLVSLNMARAITVQDGVASFQLVLTTGACPVRQLLEDRCRAAALSVPGIHQVAIAVSAEVPRALGKQALPSVRHIIAVGSGKGGVGKSTIAVNLAVALAQAGARVGILDADIYGPSVPMMLGVRQRPDVVDKKIQPLTAHGVAFVSMGLLIDEREAVVWRAPMVASAISQFIKDVAWSDLDYLLVDLPPGTGDVPLRLSETVSVAGAVVVSTPQAVALLDARRAVTMFGKIGIKVFGIVENMSSFVCPHCGHEEAIFDHGGAAVEAAELGLPFLGAVPIEPQVREGGDQGVPVVVRAPRSRSAVALTRIAERVAQAASIAALASAPGQGSAAG